MKTIKSKSILMLALIIALAGSNQLFAQRGQMRNNNGTGYQCNIPDLTEAQQKQIDELRTAHQKEMLQYRNQMQEKQAKLNTLRTADKADMAAIDKMIDEIGTLHTQMMKAKENHRQKVRSLLTEQQRVYFDTQRGKGKGGKGFGCCNGMGAGRGMGQGMGYGNCPRR